MINELLMIISTKNIINIFFYILERENSHGSSETGVSICCRKAPEQTD